MQETIAEPRPELKPHAPRIEMLTIPKEMIGALIGPGGKVIQEIQRETGTTIIVEEVDGHGDVNIFGENKEAITAALDWVKKIVTVPEVGQIYKGKVKTIVQFGAFVEILPNKDGLLHISEIDWKKIRTVDEVLKEGDEVEVKLIEIDPKTGKLKLSRKVLLPSPPREEDDRRQRKITGIRTGNFYRNIVRVLHATPLPFILICSKPFIYLICYHNPDGGQIQLCSY